MKLLLDTHTFLWFLDDSLRLSPQAKTLLEEDNDLLLSIGSLWEMAIKLKTGKLALPAPYATFIPHQLAANDIDILPVSIDHLSVISTLPLHHRDPFDRLLIAQAMVERVAIVSADMAFDAYSVQRLW